MIKIDEKHKDVIALRQAEQRLCELRQTQEKKQIELEHALLRSNEKAAFEAEVERLLSGTKAPSATASFKANVELLQHDIAVLARAITEQERVVEQRKGPFSLAACAANRGVYLANIKAMSDALRQLAEANRAEFELFDELRREDVSLNFRAMRVREVGVLNDENSLVCRWLRELQSEVPDAV